MDCIRVAKVLAIMSVLCILVPNVRLSVTEPLAGVQMLDNLGNGVLLETNMQTLLQDIKV